jgi:hypothetical protein
MAGAVAPTLERRRTRRYVGARQQRRWWARRVLRSKQAVVLTLLQSATRRAIGPATTPNKPKKKAEAHPAQGKEDEEPTLLMA